MSHASGGAHHQTTDGRPAGWRTCWQRLCLAGRAPVAQQFALATGQALLPVAGLYAMQELVDAVAAGLADPLVTPSSMLPRAIKATVLAAGVAFAGGLLRSITAVVQEHHGRRLADASLQQLQQHAADLELVEFDRPGFHDQLQRAGAEAGQRSVRLTQDLIATWTAGLSLVLMAGLLARVDVGLALLVSLAAVPVAWVRRRHARLRYTWHQDHVLEQREIGYLAAVLAGRSSQKDLRGLGVANLFGTRLRELRAGLRTGLHKLAVRRARDELLVHTLASGALFAAYVYLAKTALDGSGALTLGALVLNAQAAQRSQNAVRDLLAAGAGVREHRLFLRPLVQFLRRPRRRTLDHDGAPRALAPPHAGPLAVTARALAFSYPEARPLLTDVSFDIAAGERIALVGDNGSGKSSLLKLFCGLYTPAAGELTVGGVAPHRCHEVALQRQIAVLHQDAMAFERTLRDNLAFGHQHQPDDEALWRALAIVGLEARVRELPLGLDTPWSRRLAGGVDWSQGEARRIVLARTLSRRCGLLLLDEPFAFLDAGTTAQLQRHLANLPREQTLVVVDHAGALLDCVDRVIWLANGRVRASGTIAELFQDADFAARFAARG